MEAEESGADVDDELFSLGAEISNSASPSVQPSSPEPTHALPPLPLALAYLSGLNDSDSDFEDPDRVGKDDPVILCRLRAVQTAGLGISSTLCGMRAPRYWVVGRYRTAPGSFKVRISSQMSRKNICKRVQTLREQ